MENQLLILTNAYLEEYSQIQKITISKHLAILKKKMAIAVEFPTNVAQSAVYSSQIEGNTINIGTFLQYNELNIKPKNKSFLEIQELIKAYEYAQKHKLTFDSVLKAHKILAKELLKGTGYAGVLRDKGVSVYDSVSGVKVYEAIDVAALKEELDTFFKDIAQLIKLPLSVTDVFYFAAQIHLRFVQIHPFADGNGRMSRLIEKWFIAQFLGEIAWAIHSERYYFLHLKEYYRTINLGKTYQTIQHEHCIPFLCLLPKALRFSYKIPKG